MFCKSATNMAPSKKPHLSLPFRHYSFITMWETKVTNQLPALITFVILKREERRRDKN